MIVKQLCTLVLIQFFMKGQSISKLTVVVKYKVLGKVIKLNHVRTHCQLADMLTKALSFNQFSNIAYKMGMINIHTAAALEGEYQNKGSNKEQEQQSFNELSKNVEGATELPKD